ncbi:MAG: hypothetical protein ABR536_01885 [Solirubrobacterales bacterium]
MYLQLLGLSELTRAVTRAKPGGARIQGDDAAPIDAEDSRGGLLAETEAMPWRQRASQAALRREGRIWTLWTAGIAITFGAPAAALIWIEPLAAPAAAIFLAHAFAITHLQARRGARAIVPIGSPGSAANRERADGRAEGAALGLLGDLVGHSERELLGETGLALQRGELGVWLIGEQGALLVRRGGRRVDCWCVRVGKAGDLPAGDRVAHLLLALREDELGFATVANRNFSGSWRRVRRRLEPKARKALDAARRLASATR